MSYAMSSGEHNRIGLYSIPDSAVSCESLRTAATPRSSLQTGVIQTSSSNLFFLFKYILIELLLQQQLRSTSQTPLDWVEQRDRRRLHEWKYTKEKWINNLIWCKWQQNQWWEPNVLMIQRLLKVCLNSRAAGCRDIGGWRWPERCHDKERCHDGRQESDLRKDNVTSSTDAHNETVFAVINWCGDKATTLVSVTWPLRSPAFYPQADASTDALYVAWCECEVSGAHAAS